ncbi:hypothetical protein ACLOJK_019454, partial [Asimina triloba]
MVDCRRTTYGAPSSSSKAAAMAATSKLADDPLSTPSSPPSSSSGRLLRLRHTRHRWARDRTIQAIHHVDDREQTPNLSRSQAIIDGNNTQRRWHPLPCQLKSPPSAPIHTHCRSRPKHHHASIFLVDSNGTDLSIDHSSDDTDNFFDGTHLAIESNLVTPGTTGEHSLDNPHRPTRPSRPQAMDGRQPTSSPFVACEPNPSINGTSSASLNNSFFESATASSSQQHIESSARRQHDGETDNQNAVLNSRIDHAA